MSELIGLVLFQTLTVNQVVSVIIDVAGRENISVSHILQAKGAIGIAAFEVLRVRLQD